jgi:transcriptional regulator with XRE-family HTH domain
VDKTLQRLGQRIREIRIQKGFASQEALAAYLKMHRTFVGHLETGRKDFRMTTVIRIAEAFNVSLAELFAGVETGEPFKAKRSQRSGTTAQYPLLKEVAVLEGVVQNLKQLATGLEAPNAKSERQRS